MVKNCIIAFLTFLLTLTSANFVLAGDYTVAVSVHCNDSFTSTVIQGYLKRELRKIKNVIIVEKKEEPQVELSFVCSKNDDDIAISIMKLQHTWSEKINQSSGKHDYQIGRANHYVVLISNSYIEKFCSEAVAEFDSTYLESIRNWERVKKSK